jgi:hypothetical protein
VERVGNDDDPLGGRWQQRQAEGGVLDRRMGVRLDDDRLLRAARPPRATVAIASAAAWKSLPAPVKTTTGAAPPAWSAAQVRARASPRRAGARLSSAIPAPRQMMASARAGAACGWGQRTCTSTTTAKVAA